MTDRIAKLTPWYHEPAPRCDTLIGNRKDQCLFTAKFVDVKTGTIYLCKIHADMVDFRVKPIQSRKINLR